MRAAAFCLLRVNTNSTVTALIPNNPTEPLVFQYQKAERKKRKYLAAIMWLFLTQVQCAVITCIKKYVNICIYISKIQQGALWMQIYHCKKNISKKMLGYLQVSKDRVLLDSRKQNSHSICAIVQKWYTSSIQITGQLMNVRLQLSECCREFTAPWTNRLWFKNVFPKCFFDFFLLLIEF